MFKPVSYLAGRAPRRATRREFVRRPGVLLQFGAEANEGAFKMARRWARSHYEPSKHEIIALRGAFHGRLFGTLAATDRWQYRMPFRPLAGGISITERDLGELDGKLNPETVAAVIVEPVQGEGACASSTPSSCADCAR